MAAEFRIDRGSLRPPTRYPDGRLRADAHLTRVGVFEYRNRDGSIRREYRPPEEVFRDDSLRSFASVPVTDDHPTEKVTARNAKRYAVGVTGDVIRQDGDHVAGSVLVLDAETVAKIDAGKVEISCGYECDLDKTPGVTPEGERYDAVQRNIRGNHVAIVHAGRAGSARMRLDAAEQINPDDREDTAMNFEELYKQATAAAAAEKARADKAEGERDAAIKRADEASARADAAEKQRNDAAAAEFQRGRERDRLERACEGVLRNDAGEVVDAEGKEIKLDAMSDRALREAVLVKVGVKPDALKGKSDDYVRARFDSEIERTDTAAASMASVRQRTETTRNDASGTGKLAAARAKMIDGNRNAWRADAGE